MFSPSAGLSGQGKGGNKRPELLPRLFAGFGPGAGSAESGTGWGRPGEPATPGVEPEPGKGVGGTGAEPVSRVDLLLTVAQMAEEKYPVPFDHHDGTSALPLDPPVYFSDFFHFSCFHP